MYGDFRPGIDDLKRVMRHIADQIRVTAQEHSCGALGADVVCRANVVLIASVGWGHSKSRAYAGQVAPIRQLISEA